MDLPFCRDYVEERNVHLKHKYSLEHPVTALHLFAHFGIVAGCIPDIIRNLGVDVINATTPGHKYTALSLAVMAGHKSFAGLLLVEPMSMSIL